MTGKLSKSQTGSLKTQTSTTSTLREKLTTNSNPLPRVQTGTLMQAEALSVHVCVLTPVFQVRGRLNIVQGVPAFLNNDHKPTLSVLEADVLGLESNNPAARMHRSEIIIMKAAASVILLESQPAENIFPLMKRSEPLVVYTDRFAVTGRFYMPADIRIQDFTEAVGTPFLTMSEVRIYPMFPARQGIVMAAPVGLIHKSSVHVFHSV